MPRWSMRNTSAVGKLVDNRRIAELPLNTRNVYSLIFLTPGVSRARSATRTAICATPSTARGRAPATRSSTASRRRSRRSPAASASPSSRRSMRSRNSRCSARRTRRSSGAASAASSTSSTSPARTTFRGSAYEFLRDSAFDSRDFFQRRRGEELGDFSRHQFGGAVGGPHPDEARCSTWCRSRGFARTASRPRTLDGADRARTAG